MYTLVINAQLKLMKHRYLHVCAAIRKVLQNRVLERTSRYTFVHSLRTFRNNCQNICRVWNKFSLIISTYVCPCNEAIKELEIRTVVHELCGFKQWLGKNKILSWQYGKMSLSSSPPGSKNQIQTRSSKLRVLWG